MTFNVFCITGVHYDIQMYCTGVHYGQSCSPLRSSSAAAASSSSSHHSLSGAAAAMSSAAGPSPAVSLLSFTELFEFYKWRLGIEGVVFVFVFCI